MKRILFAIALILAAAACRKEAAEAQQPGAEGMYTLVLTAHTPEPDSKVAVATDGKVSWTSGDAIAVYNSSGQKFRATLSGGAGTSTGTFTCTGFSGGGVDNLNQAKDGEAQIGIANANLVYQSMMGTDAFDGDANPDIRIFQISSKYGEGLGEFELWLLLEARAWRRS